MTGPSVLGSNGVPYVIDTFNLAGQIDIAAFEAAPDLTGNWGKGSLSKPSVMNARSRSTSTSSIFRRLRIPGNLRGLAIKRVCAALPFVVETRA